jgi:hypothetical protein
MFNAIPSRARRNTRRSADTLGFGGAAGFGSGVGSWSEVSDTVM